MNIHLFLSRKLIITLILGCFFMPYGQCSRAEVLADASQINKPPTIKVLLSKNVQNVLLEAKGSYRVYNPKNQSLLSSAVASKRDYVTYDSEGISWGDKYLYLSSIRIVPQNTQSSLLVDGIEYRGCIEVLASNEKLNIVNEIDLERYLKSTLTYQFENAMDNEVMEAIAIVSRTHAHYLAQRNEKVFWHVEAHEAGYQGFALTLQQPQIERAIDNTCNMIMTYHSHSFPATWTENSTGKTADFAKVFRKDIKTPHGVIINLAAKERSKHGWFFEMSKKQLAQIAGVQKISEIELYQDKDSQRVYALRVKNEGQCQNVDFFSLQEALGSSTLKSNDFTIEVKADKVYFQGYGQGHGVGLCLFSASLLADKGDKAQQILTHFFPNTQLTYIGPNK